MATIESDQDTLVSQPVPTIQLEGRINDTSSIQSKNYNTLEEPVSETLKRDLDNIWKKLRLVLIPGKETNALKDWDLWGPLLLCLALSIALSINAPKDQTTPVFTNVFMMVWGGSAVVTLNSKLLGGSVSFLQSVCVIGYCLFPLNVASVISVFVTNIWVRLFFSLLGFAWSTYASTGFLSHINIPDRKGLAVYPIFLFYFFISWMILIL